MANCTQKDALSHQLPALLVIVLVLFTLIFSLIRFIFSKYYNSGFGFSKRLQIIMAFVLVTKMALMLLSCSYWQESWHCGYSGPIFRDFAPQQGGGVNFGKNLGQLCKGVWDLRSLPVCQTLQ